MRTFYLFQEAGYAISAVSTAGRFVFGSIGERDGFAGLLHARRARRGAAVHAADAAELDRSVTRAGNLHVALTGVSDVDANTSRGVAGFAKNWTRRDRLGREFTLGPLQAFQRVNSHRALAGVAAMPPPYMVVQFPRIEDKVSLIQGADMARAVQGNTHCEYQLVAVFLQPVRLAVWRSRIGRRIFPCRLSARRPLASRAARPGCPR